MLTRLAELFIFGFAPLMVGALIMPADATADEIIVAGEVLYRERIALPDNAVVTVELAELSSPGAPAAIVATRTIADPGQVPVKFRFKLDKTALQPRTDYALQARITVDNVVWFSSARRRAVDPHAATASTLMVQLVRPNISDS